MNTSLDKAYLIARNLVKKGKEYSCAICELIISQNKTSIWKVWIQLLISVIFYRTIAFLKALELHK